MVASLATASVAQSDGHRQRLLALVANHACSHHELFDYLRACKITTEQTAALLRNYDAHATVLRRLLLKAAAIMPESAVGFILENVRNEYGNGNNALRHQLQLKDLARAAGVTTEQFDQVVIQTGVRDYLREIVRYYTPAKGQLPKTFRHAAVAAGAITATEILALEEFRAMQHSFRSKGLANHIWFDHVNVEAEHTDESLMLALHFIEQFDQQEAVEFGMFSVLQANCYLYDGLLQSLRL